MTACKKFIFEGIIATAFTPFKNDSLTSLNLSIIPQYADYFAANEFGAVLINGTYGEGMSMTTNERIQVADAWSKAVKKTKQQLIVQVGGTNLQDVKKLAKHAQEIHANAILCLPELYYRPKTVEQLIDYLKEVSNSAPEIPLFYYHSPISTGVTVNMTEFFEKLGNNIPSLAGIKFASTKIDECSQALRVANQYKIIVASNYILPACVAIGVDTFMPTIINVVPEIVNNIYKLAIDGNFSTAQKYQNDLAIMVDKLAELNNGVAISPMKTLTSKMTLINLGPTRKPMRSFESSEEIEQIKLFINKIFKNFLE